MKKVLTSILMLLLSLAAQQAFAVDAVKPAPDDPAWRAAWQNKFGKMPIDAAAFTAVTPRDIAAQTGKKLSFGEKIFLKIAQKRVKKQLAKGLRAQDAEGRAGGKNSMGIAAALQWRSRVNIYLGIGRRFGPPWADIRYHGADLRPDRNKTGRK
ncbi:MAG: hypothetical protein IPH12_21365 [Saprospirales bacterium]|nr:hypothetical protein [Saprospirales bacterium]